jgi:GTP-binding protein
LVADVGLVGLPNAGKSTLLAALTAARPKIADYPFTTLTPNLGVAGDGDQRVVVADVPGLIEGAHEGKGLGLTFLRHVSRARALLFVVDLTADPSQDLAIIRAEVAAYDQALAGRPSLVVATKADLVSPDRARDLANGVADVVVSGLTGAGVEELERRVQEIVSTARAEGPPDEPFVVVRPGRDPYTVVRDRAGGWRVSGPRVERWVKETDMEDATEVEALQRRLIRAGVERRLQREGAKPGDDVTIESITFEFRPGPPDGADHEASQEAGDGDQA